MEKSQEALLTLKEASKMTPYSADYLGLLIRKDRLEGTKKEGKWFTTKKAVENYMTKTAEMSYEHQQTLNVKIPAEEIRKAAINFQWAIVLILVVLFGGIIFWAGMEMNSSQNASSNFKVVEDADNNLTIYADDPGAIRSVRVMPKE